MLHVGGDVCDGYITSDVHQCATCASVLYNRIPVLVALMLHVGGVVCDGYITPVMYTSVRRARRYYITEFQYLLR
jgi:hypothetical protein